ncbi:NAD(P)/FAD-dependent oxidoreductase [Candidatus Saccharibacteria bacterium]|nr:NAD(P)/FAD-dependent oxidoreductase [Candidatus Saccharibacteria bacterium]
MGYNFDYIVIGSGPAGRTAAIKLAKSGKKVALVENETLGGAEICTRDFPYQMSLDFAYTYYKFMTSPAVKGSSAHFNFPTLVSSVDEKIAKKQAEIETSLKDSNIHLITGFAHFLDPHTIAVDNIKYTAKNFILATGSELKSGEISGLESVKYLDPDTALCLRRPPKFVFVAGGGPTGVEIAEYFAMLGIGVIIMERADHILPREDEEVAASLTDYLTSKLGVTIVTNSKVVGITEDHSSKIVVFMNGNSEKMVRVDCIVIATGSEPFLDYGLENAGVDYKRTGIVVDKYFNTTAKNIFAIGDCIGSKDSSTERAVLEAETLVENLLHRGKVTAKYSDTPRVIHTHPEIVTIGMNERDCLSRDLKYKKTIIKLDEPSCFIKTLTDLKGRFLGSTIIAPNASLAIKLKRLLTK